jgi:hypothetical protein
VRGHRESAVKRPWHWIFPIVYGLHLLDEGLVAGGLPRWSTEQGFHFTMQNWLSVSIISFFLFTSSVWLVARQTWPSWVLLALATHMALHVLTHLGASAWWSSISPGTLSGLLLVAPLAVWSGWWGMHALSRGTLVRAAIIGAATFQAPWDLLVRFIFGLPFGTV